MAAKYKSFFCAQYPIRIKGTSTCPTHKDNDVVFLCQDCKMLICTTCSITSHKSHIDSFLELSRIKTQHQNILQDFVNDTDNVKIPKLNQEISSTRTELSQCKPKYGKLREKIKEENEKCKLQLDKITEEYTAICEKMELASADLFQTRITNLEERLDTLRKLSSECKQTLQIGTAVLMYDSVSEIQEMELDIPQATIINMTEFTPGQDRQNLLKQAMGNMEVPNNLSFAGLTTGGQSDQNQAVRPKKSTETDQASTAAVQSTFLECPEVVSKFSYPQSIKSICPTSDGRAWFCNRFNSTLTLINNKRQVIQKITGTNRIDDISLHPTSGLLWFCGVESEAIFAISVSNEHVPMFNTSEGLPTSLCVTKQGQIVVGIGCSQGYKVEMYTIDGRVLYSAIEQGPVPGIVVSIAQCSVTGNIAVVGIKDAAGDSSDSEDRMPHVIVYDPKLQPLFHYRGEGIQSADGSVTPDKFDPATVVYDSKGNILVNERTRNTIELISGTGKHIRTLLTNKGTVGAIGIQKDDVLWSHLRIGKWGVKLLKYYCD
ncbi:uncharacterized protein LOC117338643 [Pecten maximus]|uniref:uncharacterized protein LOC117338643 n=1 Tax=Pecten maximus TaxID=6579 RepID=UPI001458F806|nr:uncharacterized protein LOC117338643 [Pecten maximus]XP_033755904.1 uncharacterized protein LOC117338643 [Pecten maximus]XP_033755913.1 uncharacterized protein LOC117338643 [Pecten maximus]